MYGHRLAFDRALLVLSGLLVGLALAAQGGRVSQHLDVLTHFAPMYLIGGIACGGLAVILRPGRWRRSLLLSGLACVLSGSLMLPEFGARELAPATRLPRSLKIIQFNVWSGNRDPDRVAAWLIAQRPDLIVLEEGGALNARLAKVGYFVRCRGCDVTIFSRTRPVAANAPGWSGDSRFPDVPTVTFVDAAGRYTVMAQHRVWPTDVAGTLRNIHALRSTAAEFGGDRQIVAGDFNETPWSFSLRREEGQLGLERRTRALFTWPAERVSHNRLPALLPLLPIDHVFAGPGWATERVERGPKLGSDHYPVIVMLRSR